MTYADLVEFMQVCSAEMDESLEVDVQVRSSMRAQVEAENARDAEELKQLHDEFLAPSDEEEEDDYSESDGEYEEEEEGGSDDDEVQSVHLIPEGRKRM